MSKVTLSCKGFIDRRSEDLHARHDVIEERRFQHRLARNRKERERIERVVAEVPVMMQRQAD